MKVFKFDVFNRYNGIGGVIVSALTSMQKLIALLILFTLVPAGKRKNFKGSMTPYKKFNENGAILQ
jgi:hypothetical protein